MSRFFLGQQSLHEVAVSVNVRDIVVAIAVGTDSTAHKFFHNYTVLSKKVKNYIDVDFVLF